MGYITHPPKSSGNITHGRNVARMRRTVQVTVLIRKNGRSLPSGGMMRFLGLVVQIVYPTRGLTNAGVLP
ncbi:hypothetical protein AFERRID_09330 [Acidithiobacillus ferridurans]|uniref:Uncharacterized protein n=1 Tax=Acidithiobacillus ferridurans TaxID=1232575 RepID=A0A2Z6IL02_ACIFI|nr:hypothetical protein AFERRID_09330 [Acidithiobacillus ferridurans]